MSLLLDDPALRYSIRLGRSDAARVARPILRFRRVRVAHVLYRWSRCGMELQLASQASRLDPRRIAGWIASSTPPESLTPALPDTLPVRAFDGPPREFAPWLTRQLRASATHIVHARGLWMLGPALRAARDAGGLPVIFSFHGFDDASRAAPLWRRALWRQQLRRCHEIVAVCFAARDALARAMHIPVDGIRVIRNGVDTRHFRRTHSETAARQSLGLDPRRPMLLCVGTLMPVKGYDLLLDALDRLEAPCQVLFVGSDRLNGALHRRAAASQRATVIFAGPQSDLRPWYEAASALVAPSRSEGLSNVILEAMAMGLPVVATRVGGNPELVIDGHTGWLRPAEDPAALADAVSQCLNHPAESARRGANGSQRARADFSLDAAAENYARAYERIARLKSPRQACLGPSRATPRPHATSATTAHPLASDPNVRWYAYGRAAWWHLLFALDAGPGDNVLLPDLICDVMVEPLHALGIQPRYYRSDPLRPVSATDLSPLADARTRAALAVHYFGLPQPVEDAADFCRRRAIPFIEDAAHGDLTRDAGRALGSHADAVIYSVRKTHALPHGAALCVRSRTILNRLDATTPNWPAARRDRIRHYAKRIDRVFGCVMERLADAVRARTRRAGDSASADSLAAALVRPCPDLAARLARVDASAEIEMRRAVLHAMAARWKRDALPGVPLMSQLPQEWSPYAFAVRPSDGSIELLRDQLAAVGVEADIWPRLSPDAPPGTTARRWALVGLNSRQ